MKKSEKSKPVLRTETLPAEFVPTQKQIEMLARRIMPEIKKFFADEQIQREFADWKERQGAEK